MVDGLELRTDYLSHRASFLALAGLLKDTFDIDIVELDRFGGPDPTSMASGYFDAAGHCVANFSAFSMPLVVDGKPVRAVGYQSGAVRPEYRGRGLYRDLMERAFSRAEAEGFEAGILLTDKPDLYRPYGFEVAPQHCFRGAVPALRGKPNARSLSLDIVEDLALVTAILEARRDVSRRFAACRQTRTFLLNACFDPDIRLSYLAGLDAVVAWKAEDDTFRLLDVAAAEMPDLDAILSGLGVETGSVEVLFPTDLLGWSGTAVAYQGSCALMIRPTADPIPSQPFMLAPMMDF